MIQFNEALNRLSMSLRYQESSNHKIYKLKIIFIGDSNVGKTSIIYHYANKIPPPKKHKPTIGTDFASKVVNVKPKENDDSQIQQECHLQIWDTAGLIKYQFVPNNFYRGAAAIILVYDIGNKESFANLQKYWNKIVNQGLENKEVFLIGNKKDGQTQKRQVLSSDALKFAKERKITFTQLCAKSYHQVQGLFNRIIKNVFEKVELGLIKEKEVIFSQEGRKNIKLTHHSNETIRRYNRCC